MPCSTLYSNSHTLTVLPKQARVQGMFMFNAVLCDAV
jgi:hypothetical protein